MVTNFLWMVAYSLCLDRKIIIWWVEYFELKTKPKTTSRMLVNCFRLVKIGDIAADRLQPEWLFFLTFNTKWRDCPPIALFNLPQLASIFLPTFSRDLAQANISGQGAAWRFCMARLENSRAPNPWYFHFTFMKRKKMRESWNISNGNLLKWPLGRINLRKAGGKEMCRKSRRTVSLTFDTTHADF